jgi:hypothetical protein
LIGVQLHVNPDEKEIPMKANRDFWYRDRLEEMRAHALATARARRAYSEAHRREWDERPLGALGRRLLDDIVPYLEFFAIARGT